MSNLYGDNIFIKEVSIESILASFDESAKLFTDFDKYAVNEGVDFKAFKNKIVEAIKKCIDKIKEFLDWLNKKFKAAWNALTLKIRGINLKKSLEAAKNRQKNKSSNESAIVNEAKYTDLFELLNAECGSIEIGMTGKEISLIILGDKGEITMNDREDLIFYPSVKTQKEEYIFKDHPEGTIEEFIRNYEKQLKDLDEIVDTLTGLDIYLNKQVNELRSTQKIIDSDNINSIEDLKKAIHANDFANKDSSVTEKISLVSKQLKLCHRVLDYANMFKRRIARNIETINNELNNVN